METIKLGKCDNVGGIKQITLSNGITQLILHTRSENNGSLEQYFDHRDQNKQYAVLRFKTGDKYLKDNFNSFKEIKIEVIDKNDKVYTFANNGYLTKFITKTGKRLADYNFIELVYKIPLCKLPSLKD